MRESIREYVSDRKEPMMDTDFQIVGIEIQRIGRLAGIQNGIRENL